MRTTPGPLARPEVDLSWHDRAACRDHDPDLWFPTTGATVVMPHTPTRTALAICSTCPVRQPCTRQGLTEEWGIWGGLTEPDRRAWRRERLTAVTG